MVGRRMIKNTVSMDNDLFRFIFSGLVIVKDTVDPCESPRQMIMGLDEVCFRRFVFPKNSLEFSGLPRKVQERQDFGTHLPKNIPHHIEGVFKKLFIKPVSV